jgi:hypothetical protein
VVSNLVNVSGIVRLEANSEDREMIVTYNSDALAVEDIVTYISNGGDEVTGWAAK